MASSRSAARNTARSTDSKGRLLLGSEYANSQFILERRKDGLILLRPAVTVPLDEAWLFHNKTALASLTKGLDQARRREFADSPVCSEDEAWISKLDD